MELLKNIPDEHKDAFRWFIDCGDDDFLYEGNSLVHLLKCGKKKFPANSGFAMAATPGPNGGNHFLKCSGLFLRHFIS